MLALLGELILGLRGRPVLLPGYRVVRLRRRIEAVLVMDRAVLVFGTDRAATDAAAVDLADFHAGCRGLPVLPVVLCPGAFVVAQHPLPLPGAARVIASTRLLLPGLLAHVAGFPAVPGFDPAGWAEADYRPVPGLMEAACRLYARHDVGRLLLTGSGRGDLARTRAAMEAAVGRARDGRDRVVVFVTGAPGAGKTLCGLDAAFAPGAGAAFLTGNPALLHVLRAALARDAAARGMGARAAQQRIAAVVQPLHAFRDHYLGGGVPPDRVLVIDEAQRCWTAAYARRKTQNRAAPLVDSEPGTILDVMARHEGWCAVVCLVGGGQEIHAGEGGLAGWGAALAARPGWRAVAPPAVTADVRQCLAPFPALSIDPALHLGEAVRAWRAPALVEWVDAVLANDAGRARRLVGVEIVVTRSLAALRRAVRGDGRARHGLVASTGARRLRAEGLAAMLWHQDEDSVAAWFLNAWPDIRSADAMEVAGTEFGVQGLELDRVGVCWDGDLARSLDGRGWEARAFRGTAWTTPRGDEALSNRLNGYRVLLTRARQFTAIWVPRGDPRDVTRDPARYEAIADFLVACGARVVDEGVGVAQDAAMVEAALL